MANSCKLIIKINFWRSVSYLSLVLSGKPWIEYIPPPRIVKANYWKKIFFLLAALKHTDTIVEQDSFFQMPLEPFAAGVGFAQTERRRLHQGFPLRPCEATPRQVCSFLADSGVVMLPGGDVAQDVDVVEAGGGHGGEIFWAFTGCGGQRGCDPPLRPAPLKLRRGRLTRFGVTASVFSPKKRRLEHREFEPPSLPRGVYENSGAFVDWCCSNTF